VKFRIDKILLLYVIILTNCVGSSVNNNFNISNNENIKIIATLNYVEALNMKIVNFEIDDLLYNLVVIDRENDNKVFDLRCKDLNTHLKNNEYDLYIIRAEFFENSFILTDTFKNEIGIATTYNILENNMSYEVFSDGNTAVHGNQIR